MASSLHVRVVVRPGGRAHFTRRTMFAQPRQVTTHLLGDLVAHDEVEVVSLHFGRDVHAAHPSRAGRARGPSRVETDETQNVGETWSNVLEAVAGQAVRYGQPVSTTAPAADLFTRTACISGKAGEDNVRFSFSARRDFARAHR